MRAAAGFCCSSDRQPLARTCLVVQTPPTPPHPQALPPAARESGLAPVTRPVYPHGHRVRVLRSGSGHVCHR